MDFENDPFDGYLHGFILRAKSGDDNDVFLCLLDNTNKRFGWISDLEYILNNNEFIQRKYSSKLKNKRRNMVSLDKHLIFKRNECDNKERCIFVQRLFALDPRVSVLLFSIKHCSKNTSLCSASTTQ